MRALVYYGSGRCQSETVARADRNAAVAASHYLRAGGNFKQVIENIQLFIAKRKAELPDYMRVALATPPEKRTDGQKLNGPVELRQQLMKYSPQIVRQTIEKLMTYAVG